MWNVLIVEDSSRDRKPLVEGLKGHANITIADNGNEALNIFQAHLNEDPFDFILLDVTIPKGDGFEVLKSIREAEEATKKSSGQEARIIMITSFKDSLMENYNMGWDDFITKPVDVDILIKRMQSMLSEEKPSIG